ncbi:PREDICTED: UDP-glucuronosyltransferase 2B19-like [Dinoponera quadriceps]|uniref:UDP-glucuronosyltransferase n=1 Tax=Dinoponera quadriceps TaxID=609295 RepID=A0A6P3XN25_DINQU|nr:PREDICTED: UDP-glucuronosyltransferase 2B19-like [Dinoponera quadriceps]
MKLLPILLTTLVTCDQIADGYRILGVFPYHYTSHWIMPETLMKGLAQRSHQVDVISHFPQKKPISNYTDISLSGSMPILQNNFTATEIAWFREVLMKQVIDKMGTEICELLAHPKMQNLIKNPPQDPPYDLVIIEVLMSPCFLAFGRHLKVPVVALVNVNFPSWFNELSGNPFNPAYVPVTFSSFGQQMNFKERVLNFFEAYLSSAQVLYYTSFQVEYVKKYFGMKDTAISDLHNDISLYLVDSHPSLHGIKPLTPAVVEVAGLHIKNDSVTLSPEVQKWLDESKDGCVYFTFGSMIRIETFSKEIIEIFYKSFKKIAPVRVLMKVAKKEDLLPGLPDNVMTQSWFSQIAVLKHKNIRAFITHGGLKGTQEAIYFGVPMIGIPLFLDQNSNILSFERKEVAISLNSIHDVTEEKLTSALNSILKDPIYRKNVQKLSKLFVDRPMSALDTAIFWVEYVGKNGNFLQSPAMQLHWWQRNLLDIYAFLLFVVIAVLLVLRFIFWKIKTFLFRLHMDVKKEMVEKKNI